MMQSMQGTKGVIHTHISQRVVILQCDVVRVGAWA